MVRIQNVRHLACTLFPLELFCQKLTKSISWKKYILKLCQTTTNKPRQIERFGFLLLDHNRQTWIYRLVSGQSDVWLWGNGDFLTEDDDCAPPISCLSLDSTKAVHKTPNCRCLFPVVYIMCFNNQDLIVFSLKQFEKIKQVKQLEKLRQRWSKISWGSWSNQMHSIDIAAKCKLHLGVHNEWKFHPLLEISIKIFVAQLKFSNLALNLVPMRAKYFFLICPKYIFWMCKRIPWHPSWGLEFSSFHNLIEKTKPPAHVMGKN